MANLKKIYHNGTAYNIPVTSVNNSTGDVTVQETLVSGTNIKTINNTSLLGSGNIDIQSGGNYTAGNGIDITNDVISADISSADGKEYKITKVRKLPTVIDASTIYFVSTPKPFGDTITISWTETSNPAEFNPVWSDGAADAEAGDERFDNWFGYSAVLLNTSGTVTSRMNQEGGEFSGVMSTLGNITSGDNVMIEFPVRGIKMTKSGSTVTLSMTKKLNETGYQYYAFNRNGTIKDNLYLGAYKGSRVNKVLKSRSGQAKATSNTSNGVGYISLSNTTTGARACARANNTSISTGTNGWDEITWYARNYVNALYMMKYGNPNSQSVVGQGYTGGSSVVNTGGTDNQTSATYGTSSNTVQCKLFGLEDRWGNCYEWLDGAFYNSNTNLRTATTNVLTNTSWSGAIFNQDVSIRSVIGNYLKGISGTNEGMFAEDNGNGSNSTYYCDYFQVSSNRGLIAGGYYSYDANAGAFCMGRNTVSDDSVVYYGSRLMFL